MLFRGRVSDKLGRRPVLMLGMIGNVISAPLFGLAPTYFFAVLFRSFGGLINGNTGVAKAYATEITDDTNSAKLFSYLGFAWGMGVMAGPILGGGLSNIANTLPGVFSPDGFWGDYPYFLPMLTSSLISLIGLCIGYYVLDETNRKQKSTRSPRELFKNTAFVTSTAIYAISGLAFLSFQEVFPFWCRALKANGGLGWDSEGSIGIIQSSGGIAVIVLQLFVMPYVTNIFGILSILKFAWALCIPIFIMVPTLYNLDGIALWLIVVPLYVSFAAIQTCVLTAIGIGVNNSVSADILGTANGVAQSAVSLLRFIGPALAGSVFGWSLNNEIGYPFNSHLIFTLLAIFGLTCIGLLFTLKESINKRQIEDESLLPLLEK